jgi:capsule biosynthesis phosphatase
MKLEYDKSKYAQTIICDFDDTLCITTTRDWENAQPVQGIINKINNFYNKGWQIIIVTARGQLSCDGDTEKADAKYRKIIEGWLHRNGVKYHLLRFEKYLGSYYLDDKAINLEDFINLEVEEIKTGWSGAKVEKRGDRIFKTHHDSLQAAKWYNMAAPLVNVPLVHSMIGETLCLEYLKDNESYFKIDDVNDAINKFSLYPIKNPFELYIERMKKHCKANVDFYEIIDLLEDKETIAYFNMFGSFMHGDLSLENIIQTDKGMYLIDPIYKEDQWSSYLLDITKMMHSYRKYNRMFEYEVFTNGWIDKIKSPFKDGGDWTRYHLLLLEVSQWIRVIKYIPDAELKKEYHDKTKQMLNDVIKYKETIYFSNKNKKS